jgi:cellulose synthase operon protein YhjU
MSDSMPVTRSIAASQYWRGLGLWNLYFLAKFGLIGIGALEFHPLANFTFAAVLLYPLPPLWLHRLRNMVAIPIGAALFYYDTWLPPFSRLLAARDDIAGFSFYYLLELIQRLINPDMLAAGVILVVAYLFFSQWLRFTVISVVTLVYLTVVGIPQANTTAAAISAQTTPAVATTSGVQPPQTVALSAGTTTLSQSFPPTDENLNAYLEAFYNEEKQRKTNFPPLSSQAVPFDLLVLNICSMSWSDLEAVNLLDHPLLAKMDIIFDNFNSATSYSGPAAIRLLRASCGQPSHQKLYEPPLLSVFFSRIWTSWGSGRNWPLTTRASTKTT